jgi:hypothetical protein
MGCQWVGWQQWRALCWRMGSGRPGCARSRGWRGRGSGLRLRRRCMLPPRTSMTRTAYLARDVQALFAARRQGRQCTSSAARDRRVSSPGADTGSQWTSWCHLFRAGRALASGCALMIASRLVLCGSSVYVQKKSLYLRSMASSVSGNAAWSPSPLALAKPELSGLAAGFDFLLALVVVAVVELDGAIV